MAALRDGQVAPHPEALALLPVEDLDVDATRLREGAGLLRDDRRGHLVRRLVRQAAGEVHGLADGVAALERVLHVALDGDGHGRERRQPPIVRLAAVRLRAPHREVRPLDGGLGRALLADGRGVDEDRGALRIGLPQGLDAGTRDVAGPFRVVLGALAGADHDDAALLVAAEVREDVVESGRAALRGQPVDDGALAARERLRGLLVVEERDDRDVGLRGLGGTNGPELHSLSPLRARARWTARRSCSLLVTGSWMRTRSSPTRRVRP